MHKNAVNTQKGNAAIIALVAVVIVAVGALAYFATRGGDESSATAQMANTEAAAGESNQAAKADGANAPKIEIKPGDPVVAKYKGQDVKRSQVLTFMQTLPANMRQIPFEELFPLALNQMINSEITAEKARNANLGDDPAVKQQVAAAKENIVRNVFVQKEIEKGMTKEKLQAAYEEYKASYPVIEERKARHIMVKDKNAAKDIIKKLKDGADFAALAKELSIDTPTKETGGEIGYITEKSPVLPKFIEAVFDAKVGEIISKPVETEGGFHIIEVLETRNQPPAPYERVEQYLAGQLSGGVLNETLEKWRKQAGVEIYDINGEPQGVEPAAGAAETPAEETAEDTPKAAE